MASRTAVVEWLLDSDPSIRWQALRDLTDAPAEAVAAERSRVATEGWGTRLLGLQTSEGHWSDDQNHGWMTTTDALMLLRELGVDPSGEPAIKAVDRVRENIRWWQLGGQPFFDGETEACINGRILAAGAYFGAASNRLADRLLGEQLADGGWNCEAPPSTRSSFNSTICVLEGLLEYEKAQGPRPEVTDARRRGQDYLLDRHLFRSRTTGEVINQGWMRFSFPTVWYYDVLRALDYLRSAGVAPDERVTEAVELLKQRRDMNGCWPLDTLHADRVRMPFELETEIGAPSRWNTLRALRVLDWFDRTPAQSG